MRSRLPVCEVIEIHQQKMATALIVAIQVMIIGGLLACIVVGTQDRPSPVSPAGEARHVEHGSWSTSAAAYPIAGHPPGIRLSIPVDAGKEPPLFLM